MVAFPARRSRPQRLGLSASRLSRGGPPAAAASGRTARPRWRPSAAAAPAPAQPISSHGMSRKWLGDATSPSGYQLCAGQRVGDRDARDEPHRRPQQRTDQPDHQRRTTRPPPPGPGEAPTADRVARSGRASDSARNVAVSVPPSISTPPRMPSTSSRMTVSSSALVAALDVERPASTVIPRSASLTSLSCALLDAAGDQPGRPAGAPTPTARGRLGRQDCLARGFHVSWCDEVRPGPWRLRPCALAVATSGRPSPGRAPRRPVDRRSVNTTAPRPPGPPAARGALAPRSGPEVGRTVSSALIGDQDRRAAVRAGPAPSSPRHPAVVGAERREGAVRPEPAHLGHRRRPAAPLSSDILRSASSRRRWRGRR